MTQEKFLELLRQGKKSDSKPSARHVEEGEDYASASVDPSAGSGWGAVKDDFVLGKELTVKVITSAALTLCN
jgi:hypothetical protein